MKKSLNDRLAYRHIEVRIIAFCVLAAIALGFWVYGNYYIRPIGDGQMVTDLSDPRKIALDSWFDFLKLLISWSLAIIGATAFMLKLGLEKQEKTSRFDLLLSLGVILLCVTSLYFGCLTIDRTIDVLSVQQMPLGNDVVDNLGRWQYRTLLLAVSLFGFHVFQYFWERVKE